MQGRTLIVAIGQRYLHPYKADPVCGTTALVGEDAMPLYAMFSLRQTKDMKEAAFKVHN
jgi:hypothetical protein